MGAPTVPATLLDHYTELVSFVLYLGRNPGENADAEQAAATLEQLLARSRTMAEGNGIAESRWRDGLYPVVAWIDEQLLNLGWPGQRIWAGRSLQRKMFQTTLAGRDFFVRLDAVAEEDLPLREVFDMSLALGFRGQFFQPDDQDRLVEIREKNLVKMGLELPLQLPQQLFPSGESPVSHRRARGLPRDNPFVQALLWLLPIAVLLGLYLVLRSSLPAPG